MLFRSMNAAASVFGSALAICCAIYFGLRTALFLGAACYLGASLILFFEEVTRDALNRWLYRTFLDHPAENRFSEAEFLAELAACGIEPFGALHRVLANDIFIGVAKRAASV